MKATKAQTYVLLWNKLSVALRYHKSVDFLLNANRSERLFVLHYYQDMTIKMRTVVHNFCFFVRVEQCNQLKYGKLLYDGA